LTGNLRPVQSAITIRRSIRQFRAESIPRAVIQQLLVAAVQAPNHRRTQPWRFFVVEDQGPVREALWKLAREVSLGGANESDTRALVRAEAKAQEITRAPVLMFVYSVPGRDSMETQENYAAVCCGIQNILLAATEEGLAAGWSTGGVCTQPDRLAEVLGADPTWTITALLYVGMPDETRTLPPIRRPDAESHTAWLA
jgi:nitroreductase